MRKWPMSSGTSPRPISNCVSDRTNCSSIRSSASASSHFGSASMPLVENAQIVADRYVYVGDDEPIPERAPVIVTAQRFLADPDTLTRPDASLGLFSPTN